MDTTITTILQHLNDNLPGLWSLATAASYLCGFWFLLRSIYQFKMYGELRTMMATQTDLKGPLLFMFVGFMLLYWPSLLHYSMMTVFNHPNPLPYQDGGTGETFNTTMHLAGNVIQLVGFVSFVRGWILLTNYTGQPGAQPVMSKAIAHIVAGLFAVNIFETWHILKNTFGI
ncbi:MAG: hypothetical protein CMF39_05130 [Legionellaceae bacterium]|nr:hypothetical protein [Legionellaceae bacterium]|tara:strand:- start:588 stop:1103 length:516 start_codon:yes stop_codon:yes gene_type:complete